MSTDHLTVYRRLLPLKFMFAFCAIVLPIIFGLLFNSVSAAYIASGIVFLVFLVFHVGMHSSIKEVMIRYIDSMYNSSLATHMKHHKSNGPKLHHNRSHSHSHRHKQAAKSHSNAATAVPTRSR